MQTLPHAWRPFSHILTVSDLWYSFEHAMADVSHEATPIDFSSRSWRLVSGQQSLHH